MRIYGHFEYDYEGLDLYEISLSPFEDNCYYTELGQEDRCEAYIDDLESSSWNPYNVEIRDYCIYSPTLDTYMSEEEANNKAAEDTEFDDFEDAEKITVYKEGKLIEEYFTHD